MTTATESFTAGELLEAALCSARCLLAIAPGPCECPCGGRWHGALAGADVGGGITPEERADRRAAAQAAATAAAAAAKAARRADPAILQGYAARDGRLSRSARGLLAELLSLPPDRQVTAEALAETGPERRDAIRRMLRELEDAGYIERRKERDDRGRWRSSLVICELHVTAVHRAGAIDEGITAT